MTLELGAIIPSRLKHMLKPLKKSAVKGKRYRTGDSGLWDNNKGVTPKIVTFVFHKGLLVVCTPTEYQSIVLGRVWAINATMYFTIFLTDLVGSYKYPGLLDIITDERLDMEKTDGFLIFKQGRDVFRMKVL